MLLNRVLGNIHRDGPAAAAGATPLPLDWDQCHQRAVRCRTDDGRPVGILLPLGTSLHEGDVLSENDLPDRFVVRVRPCALLRTAPLDPSQAARVALEFGNLHLPLQIDGPHLNVLADDAAESVLQRLGIPYQSQLGLFEPQRVSVLQYVAVSPSLRITRQA